MIIDTVSFRVEGIPKAQPRPRAFAIHGSARMYDPGTADGWKQMVAIAAKQAGAVRPEWKDKAFELYIEFFFARPARHFTKRGLRENAPKLHIQKPDLDNLEKAVMDALTAAGVWKDDCQCFEGHTVRHWSEAHWPRPGCIIRLFVWDPMAI